MNDVKQLKCTVVHSGHLFPNPSHNTTVLKCCVVAIFSQQNKLKLLCCEKLSQHNGSGIPYCKLFM